MNRFAARTFSLLALCAFAAGSHARAAKPTQTYTFQGQTIAFQRVADQQGAPAIAVDDPGLRSLLGSLAATLTWQSDQRYILVTTAEPLVISFALGERRYDVGPIAQTAPFAPFLLDGRAYVPMNELLHALGLAVKTQGTQQILQPQITSLDIDPGAPGFRLVARGALPLDGKIVSRDGGKIVVVFGETGSALPPSRTFDSGPVRRIDVTTSGSSLHPRTTITLFTAANAGRATAATDDQRDFTLAFNAANAAPVNSAEAPMPSPAFVHVTGVQMQDEGGAVSVHVSVDGNAAFEWHRLRAPDNRVWIDVHNARLGMAPQDSPVRVHQQSPDTVRIALTLSSYQTVQVASDAQGVTLTAGPDVAGDDAARGGNGTAGTPGSSAIAQAQPSPGDSTWKFAPRPSPSASYVPANPRLIVIDPGHGGSDPGSLRGTFVEKSLALDMAERLRDILVKRGWQVMLTRQDDRDVYAPNDSAADELQARDDIANHNGARLFLSIHVNAFMNAGPHGATVYYYKPEDYALAQALDHRIGAEVNVKNDGVVKDKLYVVHHAEMPAALIETAYVSNPDDRELLGSPQWRQSIAEAIADGVGDYAGPAPSGGQSPGQ